MCWVYCTQIVLDNCTHFGYSVPMLKKGTIAVCERCGFEWLPKVELPERCPSRKCRSRHWNSATVEKQFREATPRVIAQATEPEYRPPAPSIALNIPGVKLGKDIYKPYVPEKYRKGQKSKFFQESELKGLGLKYSSQKPDL